MDRQKGHLIKYWNDLTGSEIIYIKNTEYKYANIPMFFRQLHSFLCCQIGTDHPTPEIDLMF